METPLLLASASPRRRKILESMGLEFEVAWPDADEIHDLHDPILTVRENATRKFAWARKHYPEFAVIAADTVVVFAGECLGKPKSIVEAVDMLRRFSACSQTVFTGVALGNPDCDMEFHLVKSVVHFRELSDASIEQYVQKVNPLDKAGGYDVDQHAELFVRGYEGSWTNIMGLPKHIVEAWRTCR
jgi:septum formation protein